MKHKKKCLLFLLVPLSFLLIFLARNSLWFAEEIYAKKIYSMLSLVLNRITGIFPFSLGEIIVVSLPFVALFFLIRLIFQMVKKKKVLLNAGANLLCFFSIVLFVFVLFCGMNYYRRPFLDYSNLVIQQSSTDDLYDLCIFLTQEAREAKSSIEKEGLEKELDNISFLAKKAEQYMEKLGEEYPVLAGHYARPKPVFFSKFMSMTETTGIFFPFTMEANVNVHCTNYTIPATMCHELSHLRGFMREEEANYIAYLACKKSKDPIFSYSGDMLALGYAMNQLYKEDKTLYAEVEKLYTDSMLLDLREDYEYWVQFEDTTISTTANIVNDVYLKANAQRDGTKSYGRMLDLLLAEYKQQKEKKQ